MKLRLYKLSIALLSGAFFLTTACKKEYASIEEVDQRNIDAYIQQNNLSGKLKDTLGFYYQVITPGNGDLLKYDSIVPVIFTVRSLDGRYSSVDTFAASNRYGTAGVGTYYAGAVASDYLGYFGAEKGFPNVLKKGVKEILKRSGGEIRMIVPSRLAYGVSGYKDIPGNACLDYSIKVINGSKINEYDQLSIQKHISANSLSGFQKTSDGIWYKILNQGSGSSITVDSTVTVKYTGKLFNGEVFDQTPGDNTSQFVLSGLIPGWQKGIPLVKEGGKIRLLIPSTLAYGFRGSREQSYGTVTIPTASCLDFEIEVTDVAAE